jgi:GT2 family glycosyltransferase
VSSQSETDSHSPCLASVIVPWWDHTDLLRFWESNLEHLQDAEVIFIDNGSSANSQAELQGFCQRHAIQLIRNETNRGYAAANNQGAQTAVGEYLLFLNNDIEVLKPPVQYLCALAGEGISGPGPFLTETQEICIEGWALCLKKTTLTTIGSWCEDYGAGYWDDVDLCYRSVLKGYPLHHSSEFLSGNWQAPGRHHSRTSCYISSTI